VETWLISGEYAVLDNIALRPRCAGRLSAVPMVTKSEEGFAYFLTDSAGRGWILKKFLPGQEPDRAYTDALQALIPKWPGFESGFERRILKSPSASFAGFCNGEFQAWIDGAILMPQAVSSTWAEFAESIRKGSVALSAVERLMLCCKLSEMVSCLESAGLAHRDLSSKNVLINPMNVELHFVDWDSLYHATLTMQSNTACGTNGYIAPFVKANGLELVNLTWQEKSDRFALAILNSELLAIEAGSKCVEDGGLVQQSDIDNRWGPTLFEVRNTLRNNFPDAVELFDKSLIASSFRECPSPTEWMDFAKECLCNDTQTGMVNKIYE
jgi:serine/threonine protein kinase